MLSAAFIWIILCTPILSAQAVTTPKDFFGHNVGDDYFLANYTQLTEYWKKLDQKDPNVAHMVKVCQSNLEK